jgi:hypothetical protein
MSRILQSSAIADTEEWGIISLHFKERTELFSLEVKSFSNVVKAVERERAKLKQAKIRAKCRACKP